MAINPVTGTIRTPNAVTTPTSPVDEQMRVAMNVYFSGLTLEQKNKLGPTDVGAVIGALFRLGYSVTRDNV